MFELEERPEDESPKIEERDDGVTVTVSYLFRGTNNYAELRAYVLQRTPVTFLYNGRLLGRSAWRPRLQPGEWGYVEVDYSSGTSPEQAIQPETTPGEPPSDPTIPTPGDGDVLDSNWQLSTRGGTVHINLAKETRYQVGSGPDVHNVIGAGPNGVRGCDVPGLKLTASITIPALLRPPKMRTLLRIDEPKTNSKPWFGMDAGEWLYVGCDATGSTSGAGSLTIHLEGGENLWNGDERLVITDELTLTSLDATKPAKYAHEYVDFTYKRDETSGLMKADTAYVMRVFDSMNFADVFGFGGRR